MGRTEMVVVAVLLLATGCGGRQQQGMPTVTISRLPSPSPTIALARRVERAELVASLRAAVRSPATYVMPGGQRVSAAPYFHDPGSARNIAIGLLGRMQAAEAVPDLMWALTYPAQGEVVVHTPMTPAGEALLAIGHPAVRPLLELVAERGIPEMTPDDEAAPFPLLMCGPAGDDRGTGTPVAVEALTVLVGIQGERRTALDLQGMAEEEGSAERSANLKAALAYLEANGRALLAISSERPAAQSVERGAL